MIISWWRNHHTTYTLQRYANRWETHYSSTPHFMYMEATKQAMHNVRRTCSFICPKGGLNSHQRNTWGTSSPPHVLPTVGGTAVNVMVLTYLLVTLSLTSPMKIFSPSNMAWDYEKLKLSGVGRFRCEYYMKPVRVKSPSGKRRRNGNCSISSVKTTQGTH